MPQTWSHGRHRGHRDSTTRMGNAKTARNREVRCVFDGGASSGSFMLRVMWRGNPTGNSQTEAVQLNSNSRGTAVLIRARIDTNGRTETGDYWWIAINGASAAASSLPMTCNLTVSPVPSELWGFGSHEDARQIQKFVLTAPIPEVERYVRGERGDLPPPAVILFTANPEPPTRGATLWEDAR